MPTLVFKAREKIQFSISILFHFSFFATENLQTLQAQSTQNQFAMAWNPKYLKCTRCLTKQKHQNFTLSCIFAIALEQAIWNVFTHFIGLCYLCAACLRHGAKIFWHCIWKKEMKTSLKLWIFLKTLLMIYLLITTESG